MAYSALHNAVSLLMLQYITIASKNSQSDSIHFSSVLSVLDPIRLSH